MIKPLCLGVADGKKSMRDACIEAIDKACHAEGVTRTPCCAVLIGGMAGKDSGLVKPVSTCMMYLRLLVFVSSVVVGHCLRLLAFF